MLWSTLLSITIGQYWCCSILAWFIPPFSSVHRAWGGWAFWVWCWVWCFWCMFQVWQYLDEVYDLNETPLEGSRDVFMHKASSSLCFNYTFPCPLDHSHISLRVHYPLFPTSILLMHPLIVLRFVMLMLTQVMWITCLICLLEMLIVFFL